MAQINFDTRRGKPVMIQIYAGLNAEHKLPDGTPSAWAASFGATLNGYFMYNRVIYVRQCNIRPMMNGKLVDHMPIYHAAVVFMLSDKLSHVLLIKDDSILVNSLQNYNPINMLFKDGRMSLREYWPSVGTSQVFAMESPEQADMPYRDFQCVSLPWWTYGKAMRNSAIKLAKFDQKEVYLAYGVTVLKNVDYVLDRPELKITLHHAYVYTDYKHEAISLIQRDICK